MQKLIYLYRKDLDSLFLKRAKVTNNDASVCVGKPYEPKVQASDSSKRSFSVSYCWLCNVTMRGYQFFFQTGNNMRVCTKAQ